MQRSESAIVLFTLSSEAEGRRKPLGLGRADRAAAVFATLIRHAEEVCSGLPGVDLIVSTRGAPSNHPVGLHLPQRGRDFGESLRLAIEDAFALGYRRVVIIGNDAPGVSRSYLMEAFSRLDAAGAQPAAVLGPSRDGGYVLLGINVPCREAFESMPWGTGRVARLTEERLAARAFRVSLLPALDDIDDHRGLVRFIARARANVLSRLARTVATIIRTRLPHGPPHQKRLTPAPLAGAHALRAPPNYPF